MRAYPRGLPELLLRLAAAGALVLGLSTVCALNVVDRLLPAFLSEITILDPDYRILSLDVDRAASPVTVRLRANLAHPLSVSGRTLYPFGAGDGRADGSPLTDLPGYGLYFGSDPDTLRWVESVPVQKTAITFLVPAGTYCFAMTSFNSLSIESDLSPVACQTI